MEVYHARILVLRKRKVIKWKFFMMVNEVKCCLEAVKEWVNDLESHIQKISQKATDEDTEIKY